LNESGLPFGRYLRDIWLPFVVQRSSGARSPRTPASYEKAVRRQVEPYRVASLPLEVVNARALDGWLGDLRQGSGLCERSLLLTCHIVRAQPSAWRTGPDRDVDRRTG
jgi:hypothetical protein